MTIPSKFHINLDALLADLGPSAPSVRVTEESDGVCAEFSYTADIYAGRVQQDLPALAEVAGWRVSDSWMPYCADPRVVLVCLKFSPPVQVVTPPKPVKPRK